MEPERKIEKWLRAFAKKRREQAGEPMQLHPAARQRLQREIARQSEEKSRGGFFSSFFFGPRLKLTFAACFTALAVGGWFLLHESAGLQPAEMSMNHASLPNTPPSAAAPATPPPAVMSPAIAADDKKTLEEKQKPIPAAPQPTQPTVVSANRAYTTSPAEATKERDRADNTFEQRQLAGTAGAAPMTNQLLAFKNETTADSLAAASTLTKDSPLATSAVPQGTNFIAGTINADANVRTQLTFALQKALATPNSTSTALFDNAKATGAITVSQVFNRTETSSARRSATTALKIPTPVLASFRVEQNGNDLTVVDADGSIYNGSVQIAQQEPAADYSFAAAKTTPAGTAQRAQAAAPAPQGYFFRVAGTNRNLNEHVVFSGNFVPFTNSQLTAGTRGGVGFGGGGGGRAVSNQTAGQPVQAILSNSRISGNVVIGDQKAIDLTATPAH